VPGRPPLAAEALRHHDAVTSAALAAGTTPLPVRFGEVFDDDAACLASIRAREAEFLSQLARIDGRVEMTVAISLQAAAQHRAPGAEAEHGAPGRQYMERLRAGRHDEQILAQQGHVLSRPVVNAVRAVILDERATLRQSPPVYLLSHLIARQSVDEYRRLATAAIGPATTGAAPLAVIRGPSAPYSFAGGAT